MRALPLFPAILIAAAALVQAPVVDACTCEFAPAIHDSYPTDGETGVPTNVVPWLHVRGGGIALFDQDGSIVVTTTNSSNKPVLDCSEFAELVPDAELEPNAQYTITLAPREIAPDEERVSLTFTTASGPSEEEPPVVPELGALVFDWGYPLTSSCETARYQACVAGSHEGLIEMTTSMDGEQKHQYVVRAGSGTVAYLGREAGTVCVELRARDAAGRRSEPTTTCQDTDSASVALNKEVALRSGFGVCEHPEVQELISEGGARPAESADDTDDSEPSPSSAGGAPNGATDDGKTSPSSAAGAPNGTADDGEPSPPSAGGAPNDATDDGGTAEQSSAGCSIEPRQTTSGTAAWLLLAAALLCARRRSASAVNR